ncbi:MAG: SDR family NAD(P)-dependent oxidoreductase, partial [Rhodospirillaceae bacterium]|nr:SDR family NAD(P)-dependent oxidoreductase [Rhodospirillaceae bacterium]
MAGRVEGKIAIVTGGGTGIGRATAQRLAAEGAIVTITDVNVDKGQAVATELGGAAAFVQQDVRVEADWQRLMDDVARRHGRPDILHNNAGILSTSPQQWLADTDMAQWRAIQAVNVEGVFLGCKYGVAAMSVGGRAKGGAGGGAIVNMSSVAGLVGTPGAIAYGASKGAVRQMTKSVAIDCAKKGLGIRCNSVHPGIIRTEMGNAVMDLGGGDPDRKWAASIRNVPMGEEG